VCFLLGNSQASWVLKADVSEPSICSIIKGIFIFIFIHLPLKMEPIEGSETSAFRTQTPGKYPKENVLQEWIHRTSHPQSFFIHLSMKMEPIEGSETSAFRTQTPGNYPKENILHKEHGESLKSRIKIILVCEFCVVCGLKVFLWIRYWGTCLDLRGTR